MSNTVSRRSLVAVIGLAVAFTALPATAAFARKGADDPISHHVGDDKGGGTKAEPGDDRGRGGTKVEAGDDKGRGTKVEAGDDKGRGTKVEAGDDKGRGGAKEPGDDKGRNRRGRSS